MMMIGSGVIIFLKSQLSLCEVVCVCVYVCVCIYIINTRDESVISKYKVRQTSFVMEFSCFA